MAETDLFASFLGDILRQGRALIAPGVATDSPQARELLRQAHADDRLSVAGPEINFDADVAVAAGLIVRAACVALVDRGERAASLATRFRMPLTPLTAEQHLSADLTFRFLPQVVRRARGLDPDDPLIGFLVQLLRAWPLSGVLVDIDAPPTTPLDFGDHPGLCLLYAERLAHHDRPSWYPKGVAAEYRDLIRDSTART